MLILAKFFAVLLVLAAIVVILAHWMFKVLGLDYKDED